MRSAGSWAQADMILEKKLIEVNFDHMCFDAHHGMCISNKTGHGDEIE